MSPLSNIKNGVLVVAFHFFCITSAQNLEYDVLESLGLSCFPKDSCNRISELSFSNRSCECDNACNDFNDCCIDAPRPRTGNNMARSNASIECMAYESDLGIYAITRCPANYQGLAEIKSKCESEEDISDPLAAAPVTDIAYHITYKNRYCAQCNDAESTNLRPLDINVVCEELPTTGGAVPTYLVNYTYVEEHLIFLNNSGASNHSWGFYYPEDEQNASRRFYPCSFPFYVSDTLRPFIRFCRTDLISTCAPSWTRQSRRQYCEAYMAVVQVDGRVYKNPHCALCNFEIMGNIHRDDFCTLEKINDLMIREKKPALSFTLLMDVNMSDGDKVGSTQDNRCPKNKMWDPFAKRCRNSVCVPGYRIQNGQCAPA